MTRLKSVALFAVAAALSSPVLAQDDPNQSAVNSDTSFPNSPYKVEKGFPDAGEFNPTGRYVPVLPLRAALSARRRGAAAPPACGPASAAPAGRGAPASAAPSAAASPTAASAPCGPRLINSRLICNQASARRGFFVIFTRSEDPRMNAAGV